MPSRKKNLSTASDQAGQALTLPEAPVDLWEQLASLSDVEDKRPADSFTLREFRERFNLTERLAINRLSTLLKEGKVARFRPAHDHKIYLYYLLETPDGTKPVGDKR